MSSASEPKSTNGTPPAADAPPPKGSSLWIIIGLVLFLLLWMTWSGLSNNAAEVDYHFFVKQVSAHNISRILFRGSTVRGEWITPPTATGTEKKLPKEFTTTLPDLEDRTLLTQLNNTPGLKIIRAEETGWDPGLVLLLSTFVPLGVIVFLFFILPRLTDPMSGGGMFGNFGRSPARRFVPAQQSTTFLDVADMDNAKRELQEVVEFLKNPETFQRLGATIPKGVLLMGPPGTGKTLLARAVAGEAGVTFYSINGSEFIQMFVGVGASRVRDLFVQAKEHAPCVIFIDEIDAVGRIRGAGFGGGHDEREQTLNQILSEMDGFQQTDSVIVLAATNRPDVLDPALLRPGRFDRHVTVDRPNRKGRAEVLKVHSRKVPLADTVDLDAIAGTTIGFSGADLRNLVNEAALQATRLNKSRVDMDDFEQARDKVMMGPKREEILNPHEREMTAYHEAGHALLAWLLSDVDIVHKVTIIPRGRALGVTQLLPKDEHYNIGEKRLHSQLTFVMGGRAAEKLVFDEFTAGAEDDLNKATQLARRMVSHWGMSEVIGPVAFRQADEHPFLGKEIQDKREFSEDTARIIDQEVQRFLTHAADKAMQMLREHRVDLDRLAQALLEKEVLDERQLTELLGASAAKGPRFSRPTDAV